MAQSNARGLRAGRATIELSLLGGKVEQQMRAMSKRMQSFGTSMAKIGTMGMAAGGAITGAFAGAVSVFNSVGDSLAKASDRTGLSVESLGELGYAAAQSGSSMAALEKGIRGMSRNILDAGRGLATAQDNFADLGVSLDDLEGKTPEQQFLLLAKKVSDIEDPTRRAALAMKVFGKSGVELLPMLANGMAGIDDLRERAKALGLVMSNDDAQAAVKLGDLFSDLWKQLRRVSEIVGASLAKHLSAMADVMTRVAATGLAWLNANRGLVVSIAAVGVGLMAAGAAFIGLGLTFTLLGGAAAGIASAIGLIGAALGALLSPVGLIVAGLGSLATWFLQSTAHGKAMVANLSAWFGELAATAKRIFGSITSALALGEIGLAGEVAMAALHVAWLEGTKTIHDAWIKFKDAFMRTTTELVFAAQEKFAELAATVKKLLVDVKTLSQKAGEKIGHWATRSADPEQRKHDDKASSDTIAAYEAAGEKMKDGIDNTLEDQKNKIDDARTTAQIAQDEKTKAEMDAAIAARKAAEDRLKAAEAEVEQKRREVAREKADAVAPLVPELQKAVAAGMGDSEFKGAGGLFDTRFARQMMQGPAERQEALLGKIEKNTRRNGGIAVV